MAEADNFKINLSVAISRRFGPKFKDEMLAGRLGTNRTTISRLRNGKTDPGKYIQKLSDIFEVDPDLWRGDPKIFAAAYDQIFLRSNTTERAAPTRRVELATIEFYRVLWKDCFNVHQGQYIAYWKAPSKGEVMASLLDIYHMDKDGIRFRLINPYVMKESDETNIVAWTYEGVLYPIDNILYFVGEHSGAHFEILNLITSSAPMGPPDLLFGCMSGVYVNDGRKRPAVNIAIVLAFQRRRIPDWRSEIGGKLGRLPEARIQGRIRDFLANYPGVISLDA